MEGYINDEDRFAIRSNYTGIKDNLRPYEVINALHGSSLFNNEDYVFFEEWKTQQDLDLTEYLIFKILLQRATYEHLEELRKLLIKTQPEVVPYFPEVKVSEENNNETDEDVLEEAVVETSQPSTVASTKVRKSTSARNSTSSGKVQAAGPPSSGRTIPAKADDVEVIEELVQPADEPDGKATDKGFMKSLKRKFSFKKKRNSTSNFRRMENNSFGHIATRTSKKDVGIQATEDQPLEPAGLKRLLGQNQKNKPKRITSFTDAFLHYRFKDKGRPYGRGMCVIFALFTNDLPGYVYDVKNLEKHFKDMQYEVRSGLGYTNITRAELFTRISEVTRYMEEKQTFDRLVVVVLTHGKKDGILTCQDTDGLIEEQQEVDFMKNGQMYRRYGPVKTSIEEIVNCFKHDKITSMKDLPKLFLVQACRGQGVVQAAHAPIQAGLDEVDASGLDISKLDFQADTPIDGDILVCNATTENHSSLVNPHTGSWFIQKTLDVFQKYQTREHVVDMMTVVNLAVSELRGAVYPKDADPYKAIQIPCIVSSLRKKFFFYNAKVSSAFDEGNQGISRPINVQLPPQFVQEERQHPMVRPGPAQINPNLYPSEPTTQRQQMPKLPQQQFDVSNQQCPISQGREKSHPTQNISQRQPAKYQESQRQQQLPGVKPNVTERSSPYLNRRQPDRSNMLPIIQQQGVTMQNYNGTKVPTFTTVQPMTVYHCDAPGQVEASVTTDTTAPLAVSET